MLTSLLTSTFGIEIECFLPEGATAASCAAAVSARIGETVHPETYNHGRRTWWKVVADGSLGDYQRGVEFVSPILRGEVGLVQAQKVAEALTDFGCTVNKRCGLHVHVGVDGAPLSFFKNLVKLYAAFEPVIDSFMPPSRRKSACTYARSLTSIRSGDVDGASSFDGLAVTATPGASHHERRYFKVNLQAYLRHRTVEFRQHSGTLDAGKIRHWTLLCLRMVAAAKAPSASITTAAAPVVSAANRARVGSKARQVGEMVSRPAGATGREVCAALGWPSVSMPAQLRACGLAFTTQRTGREVRYFAVAAATVTTDTVSTTVISLASFIALVGADDHRAYLTQRVADLSGPVAWAA
jgi:hypothetical protein